MPESPPRKRFQFHLSTAIVMMFVAGALMWANSLPVTTVVDRRGIPCKGEGFLSTEVSYGWPSSIQRFDTIVSARDEDPIRHFVDTSKKSVVINAFVLIGILFAVCFLCEWLIRRRAARKGS